MADPNRGFGKEKRDEVDEEEEVEEDVEQADQEVEQEKTEDGAGDARAEVVEEEENPETMDDSLAPTDSLTNVVKEDNGDDVEVEVEPAAGN